MKNWPLGVGHCGWPTPTRTRHTTLPAFTSVAVKCRVSIFNQVRTGCSSPRLRAGTQPVVPLGRTGSLTCSHAPPAASVVRASTSTRSSVPTGERLPSFATSGALPSGRVRAIVARSMNAKYAFVPRRCRCSTRAGAPGAGAAAIRASSAAPRATRAPRPRTSARHLGQRRRDHAPRRLDRDPRLDRALVGLDGQPARLLGPHREGHPALAVRHARLLEPGGPGDLDLRLRDVLAI